MASPEQVEAYADDQRRLIDRAQAELLATWTAMKAADGLTPTELVDELAARVVAFAEAAAELALLWYEHLRESADTDSDFTPTPFTLAEAAARFDVAEALDSDDPEVELGRVTDRHLSKAGKDTIARNAERDPAKPRWARMPVGVTCAWCLMLASRGAAYASRRSASVGPDGEKYHRDDDCTPVPVWSEGDLPYDADALYQVYADARAKVGGDPNRIAAQIRRDHWDQVTDGVLPEDPPAEFFLNRTLHPDYWDRRQAAVGIDFKGDRLKPIELLSVERLVKLDQDIDWLEEDLTTSTGDFIWGNVGDLEIEMKSLLPSTPVDLKRIRRPVVHAAEKAWLNHGVVKDKFLVDISPRSLSEDVRTQLSALAGSRVGDISIARLWILSADGIEEITQT